MSTSIHQRKTLSMVLILLLPLSLLLRSSISLPPSTQNKIHESRTITFRTKDPLPFSKFLEDIDRGGLSGEKALTGSYTLGEDYLLENNAVSTSGGFIQFPPLDLWSVLSEEATSPETRPFMMNFGHPVLTSDLLRKGSDPKPNMFVDSFLGPDSKFESVVAAGSNLVVADDHALLTRRGYKMGNVPNQDRILISNFFS